MHIDLLSGYGGDRMSVSGANHPTYQTPFSGAGLEFQDLIEVVGVITTP